MTGLLNFLKNNNIKVINGRPNELFFSQDTFDPYDRHPGPLANYYWYNKIKKELKQNER